MLLNKVQNPLVNHWREEPPPVDCTPRINTSRTETAHLLHIPSCFQMGLFEMGRFQMGRFEMGLFEMGRFQMDLFEMGRFQMGLFGMGRSRMGRSQMNSPQMGGRKLRK